ncbi:uncharacterized protein LOC124936823 isoform X2 [Impatiens glandulifera]|uniref:uncharacterized protein LOC124936823 isoform X2 n=1 Tax=Impatiens glandulifera TaxID=253017 RepID=UPI001FB06F4C|nr:uncharacterized protein LOC124936823 isoform X2 [Impatiens glandulifera]
MSSLGLQKKIENLRSITSTSPKTQKTPIPRNPKSIYLTPTRRSPRLNQSFSKSEPILSRRSSRLRGKTGESSIESSQLKKKKEEKQRGKPKEEGEVKPVLSPEQSARRCVRKGRGVVYSMFGICCHFCRQKTLCSEDDCKRCGELDFEQPCIGKTECSLCHSSYGILCRGCLKVRYGEELEEVKKEEKKWMCPHCIEDQGINPFWICNRKERWIQQV